MVWLPAVRPASQSTRVGWAQSGSARLPANAGSAGDHRHHDGGWAAPPSAAVAPAHLFLPASAGWGSPTASDEWGGMEAGGGRAAGGLIGQRAAAERCPPRPQPAAPQRATHTRRRLVQQRRSVAVQASPPPAAGSVEDVQSGALLHALADTRAVLRMSRPGGGGGPGGPVGAEAAAAAAAAATDGGRARRHPLELSAKWLEIQAVHLRQELEAKERVRRKLLGQLRIEASARAMALLASKQQREEAAAAAAAAAGGGTVVATAAPSPAEQLARAEAERQLDRLEELVQASAEVSAAPAEGGGWWSVLESRARQVCIRGRWRVRAACCGCHS
jgi:hypothetical protein